jgi:Asp-tRNA(Asn)/Glu-tRNA(Gln) amidotransferase A subunit family amidase
MFPDFRNPRDDTLVLVLISRWPIINPTRNPSATLPNGWFKNNMLASISFMGKYFGEEKLLAFTKAHREFTVYKLKLLAMSLALMMQVEMRLFVLKILT